MTLDFRLEQRDAAHGADHGGAAGHVVFHLLHAIGGLDGNAAGIKSDALSDQTQHRIRGRIRQVRIAIRSMREVRPSLAATPQKAPIFNSLILSAPYTSHFQARLPAPSCARARQASVGVMRLPGSFTNSRVKFCDSPMMRASSIAFCKSGLVAARDHRHGNRSSDPCDRSCRCRDRNCRRMRLRRSPSPLVRHRCFRQAREMRKLRMPFGLRIASGSAASLRNSEAVKVLRLAAADQQQALRFQLRGMMQQSCFENLAGISPLDDLAGGSLIAVSLVSMRLRAFLLSHRSRPPRPGIRFQLQQDLQEKDLFSWIVTVSMGGREKCKPDGRSSSERF